MLPDFEAMWKSSYQKMFKYFLFFKIVIFITNSYLHIHLPCPYLFGKYNFSSTNYMFQGVDSQNSTISFPFSPIEDMKT